MVAFFQADELNKQNGALFIVGWDLLEGYSKDEWFEIFEMLKEVPNIRKRKEAQRKAFEKAIKLQNDYSRLRFQNYKVN